jgi:predicted nucleotidyltransferase component of viral defense system
MAFSDAYRRQVELLLRVLPLVAQEGEFALKGGTAINLFHRNLPRLSVDIDLAYMPLGERAEALAAIDGGLRRIGAAVEKAIPQSRAMVPKQNGVTKFVVNTAGAEVKIEVTPVLRGSVFPAETRTVSPAVEEAYGFAEAKLVSFPDLFAGKIVAALDRQHPRDLFDIRDLLAIEGIGDDLRRAFAVYMVSHHRPMAEVLSSPQKDIRVEFERGFVGMTEKDVALEDLLAAREALVDDVVRKMPDDHRHFLIGFERGDPDWSLLGLPEAANLPAVRWRQQNLEKVPDKRPALVAALERIWAED